MIGKIQSKAEIAQGTLQVVFEVEEDFTFKSGQYCFVTLKSLKYPDERGSSRHFSIVNSPHEKSILTIATRLSESGFKKTLNELPQGSEVELGPITGAFVLPDDTARPLTLIAGGIGITPFMSMLRYIAKEELSYKITLIYSNRNQSSAAYLAEISNFKFPISNLKLILTMTEDPSWNGEKRKINASFIKDYFPLGDEPTSDVNAPFYMVVGPPLMVDVVQRALLEVGAGLENIRIENFTGY